MEHSLSSHFHFQKVEKGHYKTIMGNGRLATEDAVSQPMRAWEERSTTIIRNCLKQLSCDEREKERTKERKGKKE